jgi:hypothetical protein
MTPDFWVTLLQGGNIMIAAIIAEGLIIVYLGRYVAKLVDKIIDMSQKTAEVMEKLSSDYRERNKH